MNETFKYGGEQVSTYLLKLYQEVKIPTRLRSWSYFPSI